MGYHNHNGKRHVNINNNMTKRTVCTHGVTHLNPLQKHLSLGNNLLQTSRTVVHTQISLLKLTNVHKIIIGITILYTFYILFAIMEEENSWFANAVQISMFILQFCQTTCIGNMYISYPQ